MASPEATPIAVVTGDVIVKTIPIPRYCVDWDKVTTLTHLKAIVQAMDLRVVATHPAYTTLQPLLKKDPEPAPTE